MSAFLRQLIAKSSENVATRELGSPSETRSSRVCQSVRSRLTMKVQLSDLPYFSYSALPLWHKRTAE